MAEQQPLETTTSSAAPRPFARQRRKRSGPRWLRKLTKRLALRQNLVKYLLVIVAVIAVLIVSGGVLVTAAVNQVQASIESLERVVTSIMAQNGDSLQLSDFERLNTSLLEVIDTFGAAYNQGMALETLFAGNADLQATLTQVGAGRELALAAYSTLNGLQPMLNFLFGEQSSNPLAVQISTGERLIELLSIGRPSFLAANSYLERARSLIQSIDPSTLSPQVLIQYEQLITYEELLTDLQSVLVDSPDLLTSILGIGGQSSFVILAANSDELRPSGGYVSTYGWLLVRNGRIEDYSYSATTDISPNPPPSTMADTYPVPEWWIRYGQPIYAAWDGSWSPDFPTTAEMAMWYYNSGHNPQSPVRGVISLDIVAFEYLLEALGQVTVPSYGVVITSDNFRDVIYDIRESGFATQQSEHKRFLAVAYRQIFEDWQTRIADPEFSTEILSVLLRALQEKHLMIYLDTPEANRALDILGWSGRQFVPPGSDYIMVADANLGNKSNSSVRRQIIYNVELTLGGSAFSEMTVLYDYSASVADRDPAVDPDYHGPLDYTNLVQIFTPAGTNLTETTGAFYSLTTLNTDTYTAFVSHLVVPYDSSERYQLRYAVPGVIHELGTSFQQYSLHIQKQPGMRAELVIVQITLPAGGVLVQVSPEPTATYSIERQILEFRLDFTSDTQLDVIYQVPPG